jgi:hypothetical protein
LHEAFQSQSVIGECDGLFMESLCSVRIAGSRKSAPATTPSGGKKIHVTAPDGWTASEGRSMRAASYGIAGPDGTSADVSVIPLPGDSGSVLDNVNRWRAQPQLAPLASFVGTVLGGIWADQSWGRFWGWDPKENGALLIVIWNAMILHARWGGMIRERGMMVMAVFGNIVTSWSWFGTNMLGIGLHSYGFTDAAFFWLSTFMLSQLLFMALGLIRERGPKPSLKPLMGAVEQE